MIDTGSGSPIVLIPGIQGRWEWMEPAVEALAATHRVISFSLCGDAGSGCRIDEEAGFDNYVRQVDGALDAAGLRKAAICGVSYGGLIAVHYAARRPERVSALVLVSAPGPRWRPQRRLLRYLKAPRLLAPLFIVRSPLAMRGEVAAAFPGRRDRWAFRRRHLRHVLRAPLSPARMAQRIKFAMDRDFMDDCRHVTAPTFVVTGDTELDQIVPVESTRDYLAAIAGARGAVFKGTGHLGLVTRPGAFAKLIGDFVDSVTSEGPRVRESESQMPDRQTGSARPRAESREPRADR
jgi:pimeloyl-ACP methyl ester carboxylesterase